MGLSGYVTAISVVRTINKNFLVGQKPHINKLILLSHCPHKYIQHFQAIITPAAHNHQIAAAHRQHLEPSTRPPTLAKTLHSQFFYPRRKSLLVWYRVSGHPLSGLVGSMCCVNHYIQYTVRLYLHTQRDGLACYRASLPRRTTQ